MTGLEGDDSATATAATDNFCVRAVEFEIDASYRALLEATRREVVGRRSGRVISETREFVVVAFAIAQALYALLQVTHSALEPLSDSIHTFGGACQSIMLIVPILDSVQYCPTGRLAVYLN